MKFLLTSVLAASLCGCMSVVLRLCPDTPPVRPYLATRAAAQALALDVVSDPAGEGYLTAMLLLTYPFWLVDFPCEAVVDTVCLPYDLFAGGSK